ncbi:MAG: glycosyltransferase family 2 protein [Lachnospiraceae bacterium]|nr:glycosyltransferase family 2 protein [Lachnospiraceae bacterium]
MNILIGIPTKDMIEIQSAISIMNLDWDGHAIDYTHADGRGVYGIAQARNRLVEKALDGSYDKLFMVDSDMIVPEDAIHNLLDPDAPIVIGCARYKNNSNRAPIFKYQQDATGTDAWLWSDIPHGRFSFRTGGVACAMIDVGLLRKIPRPWFVWEERANGTYVGEDIHFYEELHRAGITPYADGRVKCGHIGRKIYE